MLNVSSIGVRRAVSFIIIAVMVITSFAVIGMSNDVNAAKKKSRSSLLCYPKNVKIWKSAYGSSTSKKMFGQWENHYPASSKNTRLAPTKYQWRWVVNGKAKWKHTKRVNWKNRTYTTTTIFKRYYTFKKKDKVKLQVRAKLKNGKWTEWKSSTAR